MTTTPAVGHVTSGYGPRTPPRKPDGTYGSAYHRGVDIAGPAGTPVVAPEAGTITLIARSSVRGLYVIVDHGRYRTLHQHLDTVTVHQGQRVAEGQQIGVMGTSGGVARHLHTEVHDGTSPIDPAPWYAARGVTLGVAHQAAPRPTPAPPAPVQQHPTASTVPEEDDVALTPAQADALAAIPQLAQTVAEIRTKLGRQDLLFLYFTTPDGRPAVAQPAAGWYAVAPSAAVRDKQREVAKILGLVVEGWSVKDWSDVVGPILGHAPNGDVVLDPEAFIERREWPYYAGGNLHA